MSCRTASISTLASLIGTLAILSGGPAIAQTATNLICSSCVGTSDLGFGAVTTAKIKAGAITASRIKNGNITSNKFGFGAVTRPKIAAGAVNGSRMAPDITLGTSGIRLNGNTGNLTNLFSNLESRSNGLVKAWAKINADGTIVACWRCNKDPSETRRFLPGFYEVDFTPLATDIRGRPRLAHLDSHGTGNIPGDSSVADMSGDNSSVRVATKDLNNANTDLAFVVLIF